jgi:hypothetical protein
VPMQRIDGVLDGIDYHQFYLVTDDDPNAIPDGAFTDEISPHTLSAAHRPDLDGRRRRASPRAPDDRRARVAVDDTAVPAPGSAVDRGGRAGAERASHGPPVPRWSPAPSGVIDMRLMPRNETGPLTRKNVWFSGPDDLSGRRDLNPRPLDPQ